MQKHVQMAFLGKPKFERNDQPLPGLTSAKGQALLAYLAVTRQPHSRAALAGLLWSEMPEADARTNLRVTLSQVRKVVGDVVLTTRGAIEFNRQSDTWLDVAVLEQAAASGTNLQTAADLYRGDFLDDFYVPEAIAFEEWVQVERERMRQLVIGVLGRLADATLEGGEFAMGIDAARRLITIDPWHEAGHRQLMTLLAMDGQRSAALAQFETCKRLLAEELGVEPAEETQALAAQIRTGTLTQAKPPVASVSSADPSAFPEVSSTLISHQEEAMAEAEIALRNPYKGLQAFAQDDAADFFGRTTLIERVLSRLRHGKHDLPNTGLPSTTPHPAPRAFNGELKRFLAVVGPSGSGKSSVVRAGVLPALQQGALPGSEQWLLVEVLPGAHPLEEIEAALLRVAINPPDSLLGQLREDERGLTRAINRVLPADPAYELVLVIDQFEEIFTLVAAESTRRHLIDSLVAAITDPRSRLRLIITLRADFYDRPLRYNDLGDLLRQCTEVVLPLTPHELEQAIVGPAEHVGLELEQDLVQTIIHDVNAQPGALPLLQYALTELFERRVGRTLTCTAYEDSGGVTGAIARRADELYRGLDPLHQMAARQLFLRLITPGDGVPDTRRRILTAELLGRPNPAAKIPDPVATIIDLFSRYRLLTLDHDPVTRSPTVEVAHEALITTWSRLHAWVDTNREGLRIHRALTEAAVEWERLGRDDGALYRGVRLARTQEWAQENAETLNELERVFLTTSRVTAEQAAREQEAIQQRELEQARALAEERQRRIEEQTASGQRLRQRAMFLALTLGVALVAALVAGVLGVQAQRHSLVSEGLALTSASQAALSRDDLDQALALGLAAVRADHPAPQAQVTLSQAAYAPGTRRLFTEHTGAVRDVVFSPDGQTALSGSDDGTLRLWDVASGAQIQRFDGHSDEVRSVALSPDGQTALSGGLETTIRVWNVASGQEVRQFTGHTARVDSVAFSPDGQTALSGSDDTTMRLWDVATGQELRQFTSHTERVNSVAFSPDGQLALSGARDRTARLWEVASGEEVQQFADHSDWVLSVAFSPDARTILTGSADHMVRLWDAQSGQLLRTFVGHTAEVASVSFSPDGQFVLSTSWDGTVRLWQMENGREVQRLSGHTREVLAARFSPDARQILSASWDQTLRLWDVTSGAELQRFVGHNDIVSEAAFSPDGQTAISTTGFRTESIYLWDIADGQRLRILQGHDGQVNGVSFSPDGQMLISSGADATLRLWDVASGQELRRFEGHSGPVGTVAFSPDGRSALSGSWDGTLRLWNIASGQELLQIEGYDDAVSDVAFSPDGQVALAGSWDGSVTLWDLTSGQKIRDFAPHEVGVNSVAFSPDGRYALSGASDATVRLWDVASGEEVRRFRGHTALVWSVAFSPDGRTVLSSADDLTVRWWDVATGQELRRFHGHTNRIRNVAFSPDGRTALSGAFDGTMRLWRLDTLEELVAWTCANRYVPDLTDEQREIYNIEPELSCATQAAGKR